MGISPLNQLLIRPWQFCIITFFYFLETVVCVIIISWKWCGKEDKKVVVVVVVITIMLSWTDDLVCDFKLGDPWIDLSIHVLLKCDA